MRIGEFAARTKMTADAIRFYEKAGLLKKPARTQGGYRQYGNEDLSALLFVKRVHELGFSLREVRDFLLLQEDTPDCCSEIRDLFQRKLEEVEDKMKYLRQLQVELAAALRKCDRQLKRSRLQHSSCPVLQRLRRTRGAPQ